MKKLCMLTVYLFSFFQLFGQASNVAVLQNKLDQFGDAAVTPVIPVFDKRIFEVEGTRYSAPDFHEGEIWMTDDRHFAKELTYRFDEYENSVEVKYPDGRTLLLFNNQIEKCQINLPDGRKLIYLKATDLPAEKEFNRLLQVVYLSPKYRLVKNPKKEFKTARREGTYTTVSQNDAFIDKHRYFLQTEKGGKFNEIKLNLKSLIKALPDKKNQLEKLLDTPQYSGKLDDWKIAEILQTLEKQ